jgi:hypothetical protein
LLDCAQAAAGVSGSTGIALAIPRDPTNTEQLAESRRLTDRSSPQMSALESPGWWSSFPDLRLVENGPRPGLTVGGRG